MRVHTRGSGEDTTPLECLGLVLGGSHQEHGLARFQVLGTFSDVRSSPARVPGAWPAQGRPAWGRQWASGLHHTARGEDRVNSAGQVGVLPGGFPERTQLS